MILRFLQWIESTQWSVALLESLYVWPLLESTHVLSLGLFVGTAAMNDLRLLGLTLTKVPASETIERLLWWTRVGFVVMVTTGVLLFYSSPVKYYFSVFFRLKVLLLVIAGLNAFVFHRGIRRRVAEWNLDVKPPKAARVAGVVSLVVWAGVVMAGRLIAYNWFECDLQPQPAWVNWAAGCILEP